MPQRRIALRLQYDGSAFHGAQRQAGALTVQESLEDAIEALTQCPHRTAFAGRTDAGVHALGQVAALSTDAILPLRRWVRGCNRFLPATLAVQDAREVPDTFDPRRDARDRSYRYDVWLAGNRQPLLDTRAWVLNGRLDLPAMRRAAADLVGTHDFASFSAKPGARETVRTLQQVELEALQRDGLSGIRFSVQGESFLHHQVRMIVGQLVRIGLGKADGGAIGHLLAEPTVGAAAPKAPAEGLVLVRIRYDLPELADWNDDEDVRALE